jgi:putative heme-binding domain-containing protein
LRRRLEALHEEGTGPESIAQAWPYLDHQDRWIRFAARVAVERQPASLWTNRLLEEQRPRALIEVTVALAHQGVREWRDALIEKLDTVDFSALDGSSRLGLIRAYQLVIVRLGPLDGTGGGLGPDLTTSASRFSLRDLVENIVEPSKVISDQYGSEQIDLDNGTSLIGRAYEENGRLHVVYDPRNPDEEEEVELSRVRKRVAYPVSFMPTGLLNVLNPDEVLDLLAFIQSGGNPRESLFKEAARR